MKQNLLLTLIYLVFLFSVSAQNNMQITWQACFGGSGTDWIEDIIETDDGGFFLLGTTYSQDGDVIDNHGESDIWLVKTDSIGNLLWQRCYGGSSLESATNIIKDSSGFFYFGGWVGSNDGDIQSGNHGDFDRWVVKIDSGGEIIWEKCYGGSGQDYGGALMWLSDGNILVYSAAHSGDGDIPVNYGYLDIWLMKINSEGVILESHVYGNQLHNNVFSVIETSDGGYFFAGKAECLGGMVQGDYKGDVDVWVVKLNSQFEIEWQQLYGGTYQDYGYRGVMELEDGYIFTAITNSNDFDVSGFHGTPGLYESDIWVVKIDFIGNIIWQKCFGGNDYDWSRTLHHANDGGFYIIGETQSNNGDVSGNHSYPNWGWSDIWMVKLSNEGELEWQKCYGGLGDERIYNGVIKKSDNNWILGGRASYNSDDVNCNLYGEYIEDFWVFELDTVDTTGGIENYFENEMVEVFPNPAREYVVFETPLILPNGGKFAAILISDVFGQEVVKLPVKQEKTFWDCREVKDGIYFYTLKIEGKWYAGKVVIRK